MQNVKIQKLNSGVIFIPVKKNGEVIANSTVKNKTVRQALWNAWHWYQSKVSLEMTFKGMDDTEYARSFRNASPEIQNNGYLFVSLEPWGFCLNGQMGDSGSTPTQGRARVLECYQSPLNQVKNSTDMIEFFLIKNC